MPYQAGPNTANYSPIGLYCNNENPWNTYVKTTTVGSNGGPSAYGTFDQIGNVLQWVETKNKTITRWPRVRGSSYNTPFFQSYHNISKTYRANSSMINVGFRIASYSNPHNYEYFVEIGDIKNLYSYIDENNTQYGSVDYIYQINQYPVTVCEYVEFLNAIAKIDTYQLYKSDMGILISRSGNSGSYIYSPVKNMHNKPMTFVSFHDAARYCNWLHNNKPRGPNNSTTTENGAYIMASLGNDMPPRSGSQKYFIPTEDEWYKAAYYKSNGLNAGYWAYPTQSDSPPECILANGFGDGPIPTIYSCNYITTTTPDPNIYPPGPNTANFNSCAIWAGTTGIVTTVGSNGGPSAYGTYDQNGNTWEWVCEDSVSTVSIRRGGNWNISSLSKSNTRSNDNIYYRGEGGFGFRLATHTNPLNLPFFVTVRDINNASDTNFYGSVGYEYKICQYVVTNCEYVDFLNAIAKTDTYNVYYIEMMNDPRGGITRSGTSGSYTYSVKANMANKPAVYINWLSAARYCNWIHNGKPNGNQNANTTEAGAYILSGQQSGSTVTKNLNANYWLPTEDEWYKAAYYKRGGINAGYWSYATQSNTSPTCITSNSIGDGPITTKYTCNFTTTTTTTTTTTPKPDCENFFIHDHELYMDSSVVDFNKPSTNHCVRINLIDAVTDTIVQYIDHCVSIQTCECLQPTTTTTSTTPICSQISVPPTICSNNIPISNYPIINSSGCIIGYQCPESTTTTTTTIAPPLESSILYTWGVNFIGGVGSGEPWSVRNSQGSFINSGSASLSGYFTPNPIPISSGNFTKVICENNSTSVINNYGDLYQCGVVGWFGGFPEDKEGFPAPPLLPTVYLLKQNKTLSLTKTSYTDNWLEVDGNLALSKFDYGTVPSGSVWATNRYTNWPDGEWREIPRPILSIPCKKISGKALGNSHCLMITNSGELYGYGGNNWYQLGTGDNKYVPYPIKLNDKTDWVDVAVGGNNYNYSIAIDSAGDLYACGSNVYGSLGDGTLQNKTVWTKIITNMPPLKRIFAGYWWSFGLTHNNELYAWGRTPTKIQGMLNNNLYIDNWIDVISTTSSNYALFLNSSGELYQAGQIHYLSNIPTYSYKTPSKIHIPSGIFWHQASIGIAHAAALGTKIL